MGNGFRPLCYCPLRSNSQPEVPTVSIGRMVSRLAASGMAEAGNETAKADIKGS